MKIKIISDVSLQLVIKKLETAIPSVKIKYEYTENVPLSIQRLISEKDGDYDFIWIHSDNYFHKNDLVYQFQILDSVLELSNHFVNNILLSNTFSSTFSNTDAKKTIDELTQFWFNYGYEKTLKLSDSKNIFFIDMYKLIFESGAYNFYDYNMGQLYQMPYTRLGIDSICKKIEKTIEFLKGEDKKVIIVDCDNTLWKGVVGEDGVENIYCDKTEKGVIHYEFQKFLKQKLQDGFLLCISSRNNLQDVKEAFNKKNMPLRFDDFISVKIDWRNKVEHIKEMSEELNLGIDSFIFIDDSDFEINSILSYYPQITAFKFPNLYKDFLLLTDRSEFKKKYVLEEDKNKFQQYVSEVKRKDLEKSITDFEEYIRKLNIKLDIKINDVNHLDRLSQLTEKTNQFNFNKTKYSSQQLKSLIDSNNWLLYSLSVSDIYGDYGIVGFISVELANNEKNAIIENFILSCRALGRKIENNFFDYVVKDLQLRGYNLIKVKFRETEKNKPARDFYTNYIGGKYES